MTTPPLIKPDNRSETVREVRLLKTTQMSGWRWDVTSYATASARFPGVYDARVHLGGEFGYTRTKWGALRKIAKALGMPAQYPLR